MTISYKAAVAVAATLACAVPGAGLAADADILRETQDRALIAELMWNYVRAIDTLNADAYAATFTADGVFNKTQGSAALRKMVLDLKQGRADREAKGEPKQPPTEHIITNVHVEFLDRDHARMNSYWMTVFPGAPNTQPPRMAAAGRGVDDLVRVDGKWLIKNRNVVPKD